MVYINPEMNCSGCKEPVNLNFIFHMSSLYCDSCAFIAAQKPDGESIKTTPKVISFPGGSKFGGMVFHHADFNRNPEAGRVAKLAEKILVKQNRTNIYVQWVSDSGGPYMDAFVEYMDGEEKKTRLMSLLANAA